MLPPPLAKGEMMRNRRQLEADLDQARAILRTPADRHGECDRCHEQRMLWIDEAGPGEFEFCADCWRYYEDDAARRLIKPDMTAY